MAGKYNRDIHHRQSIRLANYDYSSAGAYFVTICIKNRESILGDIKNGNMILNYVGLMVNKWWDKLPQNFNNIDTDEFMIMPNHIHGIVSIVGADPCVCPNNKTNHLTEGAHTGAPLHRVIQWFKTMTTNEYFRNVQLKGWQRLDGKFWQRNYYEHVLQNEKELFTIRKYIKNNPLNWSEDKENPKNIL